MVYANKYGVTFSVTELGQENSYHTYRTWGLYPREKPVIDPPEPELSEVRVPGSNTMIDFTQSMTGDIYYGPRTGTFEYVFIGDRTQWDATYHAILKALHGKRGRVQIDEDLRGYYYGRISVGSPSYGDRRAFFTITAELDPYCYDLVEAGDDWLWDPFSFVDGEIRDPSDYRNIVINGRREMWLHGSDMPVVPDVYLRSGNVTMTYQGYMASGNRVVRQIPLRAGSNISRTPDFILHWFDGRETDPNLVFEGNGVIEIRFKIGRL